MVVNRINHPRSKIDVFRKCLHGHDAGHLFLEFALHRFSQPEQLGQWGSVQKRAERFLVGGEKTSDLDHNGRRVGRHGGDRESLHHGIDLIPFESRSDTLGRIAYGRTVDRMQIHLVIVGRPANQKRIVRHPSRNDVPVVADARYAGGQQHLGVHDRIRQFHIIFRFDLMQGHQSADGFRIWSNYGFVRLAAFVSQGVDRRIFRRRLNDGLAPAGFFVFGNRSGCYRRCEQ